MRNARPGGYTGLIFTHGFAWAVIFALASRLNHWSLWLLALSLGQRLAMAITVGVEALSDSEVAAGLWLIPLRDLVAFGLWIAGFAGNTVVWRGERFRLRGGKLDRLSS